MLETSLDWIGCLKPNRFGDFFFFFFFSGFPSNSNLKIFYTKSSAEPISLISREKRRSRGKQLKSRNITYNIQHSILIKTTQALRSSKSHSFKPIFKSSESKPLSISPQKHQKKSFLIFVL